MSQTEMLQQELQRITDLSDTLYSNFDTDSRSKEEFQLLACVVCHLHPSYFFRPISERQSTSKLLAGKKEAVEDLYEFVASSTMSNLLKSHLLGDAYGFIKSCGATSAELAQLDAAFDVRKAMQDFWEV
jgi:hypothetical protein